MSDYAKGLWGQMTENEQQEASDLLIDNDGDFIPLVYELVLARRKIAELEWFYNIQPKASYNKEGFK